MKSHKRRMPPYIRPKEPTVIPLPSLPAAAAAPPQDIAGHGVHDLKHQDPLLMHAYEASIFKGASNINIGGGQFNIITNVNGEVKQPSLEIMHKIVASNAILNAEGRADEVRCHPGTREEVIGRIEKWGDGKGDLTSPMFWLSGPAGSGKSAIVQTIAERCDQRKPKVPHANFFFFRADNSRSNATPLVATLSYQILELYPSIKNSVADLLSDKPFIFKSTLEDQVAQLIVTPLRTIQKSSPNYCPLLLLIDGLDECDSENKRSQQQILRAFDSALAENSDLMRLLVASRDESQIQAAFNKISSQCLHLYLDDKYSPENDIRVFVDAQFEQVKKTHPLAHKLNATWPSVKDIDFIVEKSSGQFVYAATAMRFISDSAASPKLSLDRVKGAARRAPKSPFAQLDAIYSYILSQVEDQEILQDILHAQLLLTELAEVRRSDESPKITLMMLLELCNSEYTEDVVLSCLEELTPIARYKDEKLLFHHASFSDYLLDKSRCEEYFVNFAPFSYKIMPTIWKLLENGSHHKKTWLEFGLCGIRLLPKLPPGLMRMIASSNVVWSKCELEESYIFELIHKLCIVDNDVIVFKQIIREWMNSRSFLKIRYGDVQHIPFGRRYFNMARADHYWEVAPENEMLAALCPETDLDRKESALWLNKLLGRIHKEIYPRNAGHYAQLLEAWISWAVAEDISCDGLKNLPKAQMYIWKFTDEKRATDKVSDRVRN